VTVHFTLTLDDIVVFNLHLLRKSGVGRTAFLMVWLGLPALCAALVALKLLSDDVGAAALFGTLGVVILVAFPFWFRSAQARNVRALVTKLGGRGIIGDHTLVLSDDKLVEISEAIRTEVRWTNLTEVEEVGEHTYLFIAGISAVVLPRRGFDSEAEYEAARDFSMRKLDGTASA
jgi:hypothetical protein